MNQTTSRYVSFPLLGLLLLAGPLSAQTATPAATGEVLELSPFTVNTSADRGYTVSESMTGSRVKIQIADLPYTVNVITSEFLEDFGILEFSDNITQIGGFTGLDVGGNFVLRGFTSSNQLRDGFFRLGRYGSSNIDRIEVIKGSNAAIYGRTSPGGMMNMISKQATGKASQLLRYNVGDYATKRLTFEAGGPLLDTRFGKSNYLLTASSYSREFNDDISNIHNSEYFLTANHTFNNGGKLTFMAESFLQERNSPLSPAPLIIDAKGTTDLTDDRAVGFALGLGRYNPHGPISHLDRGNTGFTAIYEKNLSDVFSTRVSTNIYAARRDDYNQNNGWGTVTINQASGAAPTSARGATPNWGRIIEDGGAFQGDLLAHYFTNNRKVEHRTLVTLDINDYYRWDPTFNYGAATHPDLVAWNAVRTVTLDPVTLLPTAPIQYFTKEHDPINGYVPTRVLNRRTTVIGSLLRHQSSLFEGRLLLYTGARFDSVQYRHNDFLSAASAYTFIPNYTVGQLMTKRINELKPNAGVNYKIRENFRVFASYSESFFIAQGDLPTDVFSPIYKSEIADGWDYGFKGSLLAGKLNYTVSGFYINRQNVLSDDIDQNGLAIRRRDGDQLVRGYEGDVTWDITKEFSFLGSYGNVNSIITDFGPANAYAIGREAQYVAPYNGSLSVKYTPSQGALKGFSANIGVTFVGSTPTETPIAGDTPGTIIPGPTPGTFIRPIARSTEQWKLKAPAYKVWSLGMRYTTKASRNVTHTFALNINNLLDEEYYLPGSGGGNRILAGDQRSFFFTYTINHKGTSF